MFASNISLLANSSSVQPGAAFGADCKKLVITLLFGLKLWPQVSPSNRAPGCVPPFPPLDHGPGSVQMHQILLMDRLF